MIEVNNREFFHIQKLNHLNKEWFVGDNFIIGQDFNNFYRSLIDDLENQKSRMTEDIQNVLDLKPDSNENDYKKLYFEGQEQISLLKSTLQEIQDSFKQYLKWIQEQVFEDIRRKTFPHLPSRQKCLWICSMVDLPLWMKIFENSPKKILKIRITGIIHKADGHLIDPDSFSIKDFENRAKDYWSGNFHYEDEIEYLFIGNLKVVKEYVSIDKI